MVTVSDQIPACVTCSLRTSPMVSIIDASTPWYILHSNKKHGEVHTVSYVQSIVGNLEILL
jgi:hypothetical protein